MKNLIIYLGIVILSSFVKLNGQETFEGKAKTIAQSIEKITKEQKALLKQKVEEVNVELGKGIITSQQADEKKLKLAEESALTIENLISNEEVKLSELVKEKVEGRIAYLDTVDNRKSKVNISLMGKKDTLNFSEKRTTTQFVFASGINNLVTNNALANSDFKYMGSHFYEWGLTANSRILKENNLLHFKYGMSLQYNNLRPTNNRVFVDSGKETSLQTSVLNLKDSRFRNLNIVIPAYLEFDFTKPKRINEETLFRTNESFRVGLGGYAGFNLKTKQITKYESNNYDFTLKEKGSFNVNDFVYGLGAYIGYEDMSLYVKYDLNPLFKDNSIKQNNISLGVRFDVN